MTTEKLPLTPVVESRYPSPLMAPRARAVLHTAWPEAGTGDLISWEGIWPPTNEMQRVFELIGPEAANVKDFKRISHNVWQICISGAWWYLVKDYCVLDAKPMPNAPQTPATVHDVLKWYTGTTANPEQAWGEMTIIEFISAVSEMMDPLFMADSIAYRDPANDAVWALITREGPF